MIVIKNLSKSFGHFRQTKTQILNNINMNFPETGMYAIFGKSGSGKTTLLNIIGGLDKPTSGQVLINNKSLSNKTDQIRNDYIGFVFQNYNLESNYTVYEILENQLIIQGLTNKEEIKSRIDLALKLVNLEKYKFKQASNLSGGEKQRVALARAIIKGSKIILADEPTGNLDNKNTQKVMEILKTISASRLVILVTHEINLIENYADKYYYIQDGEVNDELEGFELKNNFQSKQNDFLASLNPCSGTKKGKLFTFKKVLTNNKEQKALSQHISFMILRFIFVGIIALFTLFILYSIFQRTIPSQVISQFESNGIYLNFNDYQVIKSINHDDIKRLKITNTYQYKGQFQVSSNNQIAPINESFNINLYDINDNFKLGTNPQDNEISLSTTLADKIIKKFSLKEFHSYQSLLNLTLDKKYNIVSIHESNRSEIKLNYKSYINFFNLYSRLELSETQNFFQKNWTKNKSYISQTDERLADDEAILKVSLNSFYKIFTNFKEPYDECDRINEIIEKTSKIIQIKDSTIFIKKIEIDKHFNANDFTILVNKNIFENVLLHIKPQVSQHEEKNFFFKVETDNSSLKDTKTQFQSSNDIYEVAKNNQRKEIKKNLTIVLSISPLLILLLINFYFMEKSDSTIKKTKQYGIYRAIGVSKKNLFYKEFISLLSHELLLYFIVSIVSLIFLIPYIVLRGEGLAKFLLYYVLGNIPIVTLITLLKLYTYKYLLYLTPAQILSKYDI